MQLAMYVPLIEATKNNYDVEHNWCFYKFKNHKFAEVWKEHGRHFDRIDNDYTGDPPPYIGVFYFCDYDSNYIHVENGKVIDSSASLVLAAYELDNDCDSDTTILDKSIDLDDYREYLLDRDFVLYAEKIIEFCGVEFFDKYAYRDMQPCDIETVEFAKKYVLEFETKHKDKLPC